MGGTPGEGGLRGDGVPDRQRTGAMAAVLQGKVDAVLLTGGMAHSERLVEQLRGYVEWIAPVTVYPGEDELLALAEGCFASQSAGPAKRLETHDEGQAPGHEALVIGLE